LIIDIDPKTKEIFTEEFNDIKSTNLKSDPEPSEMFKIELNNSFKVNYQEAMMANFNS